MVITEQRVMRGPNMWSCHNHKLIVIKLSIKDNERAYLPNLEILRSLLLSRNIGDKQPHQDKLYFMVKGVALLANYMQFGNAEKFTKVSCPSSDEFYSVFEYDDEEAGKKAAEYSLRIIKSILSGEKEDLLDCAVAEVQDIIKSNYLGPSTSAIVHAATLRKIPLRKAPGGYLIFGHGKLQKKLSAAICDNTKCIAVDIASNKSVTKALLAEALIPVPKGDLVRNEYALEEVFNELKSPLVTKPLDGNQGKGITAHIKDLEGLRKGFKLAKQFSNLVVVEEEVSGKDYRVLVIGNKLIAASMRFAAFVIGDGQHSISELVELENSNPLRGEGHEKSLTKIPINEHTLHLLAQQNLSLNSIPEKDKKVILKSTANLSTGGTAIDVTDKIHPYNRFVAEKAAKLIGLDICGIDLISEDISKPLYENGGSILELNAAPGLRMHLNPSFGEARNVADPIVDLMYPPGATSRIPVVTITGTNGKTTTTRLMAHVASQNNKYVGFTTTDGIYINQIQVKKGDCAGPLSARVVLQDPDVDFAVLECARGGLIRSGLPVDESDIGIVTNVAADHLGLKDIYTIEDLARVKAIVPRSVKKTGWAILNASDDLVFNMSVGLTCNIGLFSTDYQNTRVLTHVKSGGVGCILAEDNNIVILEGSEKIVIEHVTNIPVTMNGLAGFMIENVLPVVLASYVSGFNRDKIKQGLNSFFVSPDTTPGRLNVFEINGVNLMVDYAHNPHGLKALGGLLKKLTSRKIGIITGTGDRRDSDIIELGEIAGDMYDEVIIRIDKDTRGRHPDEIILLLKEGLMKRKPEIPILVIPDSKEAMRYAVAHAPKNSYVIISADDALDTVHYAKELEKTYSDK